jgi:cytochrome c
MSLRKVARDAIGSLAGAIILVVAVDGYVDSIDPRAGRPTPSAVASAMVGQGGGAAPAAEAVAIPEDPRERIAMATPEQARKAVKACAACHTFEAGGPNRVGPNLHDVVGRAKAAKDDFKYSDAFHAAGGSWTYEDLDAYLSDPKAFIPGNKMAFTGLKDPMVRAAAIAYLREMTTSPPSLDPIATEETPAVEPAPEATEGAAPEAGTPAAEETTPAADAPAATAN